jgi:hypothetical protein
VPRDSGPLVQDEIPDHSCKRRILNFLFDLFAALSFELDYDLVALNRNVLLQQGCCPTATAFPAHIPHSQVARVPHQ